MRRVFIGTVCLTWACWLTGSAQQPSPLGEVTVVTSGGRSAAWTNRKYQLSDLWAYRALARPRSTLPANYIDRLIAEKLSQKEKTRGAPPADKLTLLRRATFDLTGLPPTPAELEAFLHDSSPRAFERIIDRLLVSKHYGERSAQHWLDVVRYADTSGFSNDFERPNAWRYRDYVVRSLNQDKPFDQFIIEQIAGDELRPNDPESLIATGFLRTGAWEHTGMSVAAVTRQTFLDDVTNHVGTVFLAQPFRCARCHDHKFDPIPTKDYYRIQAVFAPTQFAERQLAFLPQEATNTPSFAAGRAEAERRLQEARAAQSALNRKSDEAIAAEVRRRGAARLIDLPENDRPKRGFFGLSELERSVKKVLEKRVAYYQRERMRYEPFAFAVYNGQSNNYNSNLAVNAMPARRDGAIEPVHVLIGGGLESPGERVEPGVLSVHLPSDRSDGSHSIPATADGRRLALARWIARPQNPLTARVIVNRVWQWHFGRGLVATSNNFGKMGRRPTHPELLDSLATWFIDNGWSLKKLHRLIMTSQRYRQLGDHPEMAKLRRVDAGNDWLAFFPPRRLSAEELRDGMLAITGELNAEVGGPPAFPELHREVALQPRHIMGSVAPAYQPSPTPAQRNRRTLYAFRARTLGDPLLEVFNRPGTELSCDRRDETTVTPQAFALFNGEFVHARALALAASLNKLAKKTDDRIALAFRRVYGRSPTASERASCRAHLTRQTAYHRLHAAQPTTLPTKVRRKMVEEMTGEEFEWDEELDGVKDYQRDRQPWEVDAPTRALADLCLVLFNSNEFLYVR